MARISSFLKRLLHRHPNETAEPSANDAQPRKMRAEKPLPTARPTRRESDVPLENLDRMYTPPLTSSKSSFRDDGAEHQRDQELELIGDDRWNDEDRFTNKSGDPRIGTHRRTHEADESRGEARE